MSAFGFRSLSVSHVISLGITAGDGTGKHQKMNFPYKNQPLPTFKRIEIYCSPSVKITNTAAFNGALPGAIFVTFRVNF